MVVDETEVQMGGVFLVYGPPLMAVSLFKYFGITLSSTNDDWPAVEQNLRRERGKWGRLAKILVREGKDRRTGGRFYWTVV